MTFFVVKQLHLVEVKFHDDIKMDQLRIELLGVLVRNRGHES